MGKYSLEVEKIINVAENIAFQLNDRFISSEHLLLAILKNNNPLTKELSNYGLNSETLTKRLKENPKRNVKDVLYMEYTVELNILLDNAYDISKQNRDNKINLECLINAIFISEETYAYEIMKKFRIDINKLCKDISLRFIKKSELFNIADLHCLGIDNKDPLIGREDEMNQLISALSRRNKPNAILLGDPGVGKTALVEELGRLLKENKIPKLKDKLIFELDLASTLGGTKYRGEFEEKIKKILKKVIEDGNAILFIDEIHTLVHAGGAEGAIDAANILKPYLSRGSIQVIGATTEEEFNLYFEKDKALKRRFQLIHIKESSEEETIDILLKIKDIYEDFYKIRIDKEVIEYIVSKAKQYIFDQYFPDKAIDVLDNACVQALEVLTKEDVNNVFKTFYKINDTYDKKLIHTVEYLKENIYGQDDVIDALKRNLISYESNLGKDKKTYSILLYGPNGVGKSSICNIISTHYFNEHNTIYLNMTSYSYHGSINKLIGYYNDQNKFIRHLKQHPKSLIVLDEIDKASNEIIDLFSTIMEKGYFETVYGEKINTSNCLIIMMTSFNCLEELNFNKKQITINVLTKRFHLEFINKFEDILIVPYLTKTTLKEIAINLYQKQHLNFEISSFEKDFDLFEEEYQKYGVRKIEKNIKKILNKNIQTIQKNAETKAIS